jgi:hypothetical protein
MLSWQKLFGTRRTRYLIGSVVGVCVVAGSITQ